MAQVFSRSTTAYRLLLTCTVTIYRMTLSDDPRLLMSFESNPYGFQMPAGDCVKDDVFVTFWRICQQDRFLGEDDCVAIALPVWISFDGWWYQSTW